MHALLDSLRDVCRRAPLREKVVVVPSLAIGHQIGDALARSGTPWINLRFETTRTIADAVAGFALQAEGWTVLSRAQALAILERACDRVLDQSSYFAAIAGRPGLYRAIQRSVDDLRHAGLDPLPEEAFEDPRKARDLSAILFAYEDELRERKFIDRYGVLAKAIELAKPWDVEWVVSEELDLTPAEERLLQAAGAAAARPAGRRPHVGGVRDVRFVRAAGEENEIRGALRSILRDGVRFDSAELLYTSREPYLALAYELTSELAIPATFAEGVPATFTRPGQAALGFLHWIADDFDAARLQRIARAGAIKTHGEVLTPFSFGRILRAAMIGWGRDRYVPRLEAYLARLEWESEIARVREALVLVRSLLDVVDAPSLAESTLRFLDAFAATRNEIDGMALAALRRMLRELMQLPADATSPRMAIDRLADAIAAIHVSASNPRPGHLHVAPLRAGGWSGRTSFFVIGLDDAKHPGSGLQDPIILDAERRAIGHLELLGDAPARNSARLRSLLGRAPDAHWTLSYTELDLRERRARFPSRDLLEVYRAVKGSGATYEQLVAEAMPAGFLESVVPLSATEWWIGVRSRQSALAAYPWLAAGERARVARESDAITEYDGRIAVAREDIDPRLTGRVLSASQMEQMARCPFGWFLKRVLKIEPLEELERVANQWLDNRQFGSLVHEVLEKIMDELCAAEAKPSLAMHLERMQEIAEDSLTKWRADVPPGTETAFARQREELRVVCEVFLRTEERACERIVPRFFELPFGHDDDELAIPLGGGREVRLRGSIDRVDQDLPTGDWEVWDYKTGSLYEFHDAWRLKRGTKLQHAVYARALAEILRRRGLPGKVQCAGYYFPTAKGGGERSARQCDPGELERTLNLLFDVIGSGWFPQPDEGSCGFCPYPDVCGPKEEAAQRLARKQAANAQDPAVRAWRDLQEVE